MIENRGDLVSKWHYPREQSYEDICVDAALMSLVNYYHPVLVQQEVLTHKYRETIAYKMCRRIITAMK